MATAIKAEDVAIRYITGDFKDIGVKEYVARKLTGNYHVKEFMAVDGVSFELEEGEMLGIIGANGAGKSTLLKAISGIMEPTRGHIEVGGEIAALLELGSGFDGDLTVKENAYLRGAMLGYTQAFMDKTYDAIIDFAELREFEDRPFKQLSSGMRSRLAFSIASLVKPDILILDEVLSVGDGAFQEKSARKMKEIISGGATTILVSHSLNQIRELCTKVLWLDHGRQIAFGETREICDRYERFLRGETVEALADMPRVLEPAKASLPPLTEAAESQRTDEPLTEQPVAIRRPNGKKVALVFGLALSVMAMFACMLVGVLSDQILHNAPITLAAVPDSGIVRFRGAAVDGVWYNTRDIVVSNGNWALQEEGFILEATDDTPLLVQLPTGKDRTLTFDVGAGKGRVIVQNASGSEELDLLREFESEYGLPFSVDASVTAPVTLYFVKNIAFIGLLFCFSAMLFALSLLRKQTPPRGRTAAARNAPIEGMRFLFIILVCVHHYCAYSPAGYLGVDFFFVLSGFLLMRHFDVYGDGGKPAAMAAARYTLGRYRRLLPAYLLAFGLSIVLDYCTGNVRSFLDIFNDSVWEILMLDGFGFTENLRVGPGWFCSALLIAGFAVYYMLCRSRKAYIYAIAPLSALLIFSFILHRVGNLNRWLQYDTFISTGTLRGFAEIGLGCVCYELYEDLPFRGSQKYALPATILELFCLGYTLAIMLKIGPSAADFVCVLLMALLIISLFIGNSFLSKALDNRASAYLGKISLAVFLNHTVLARANWSSALPVSWHTSFVIYLIFVVVFSCVSTALVDEIVRRPYFTSWHWGSHLH